MASAAAAGVARLTVKALRRIAVEYVLPLVVGLAIGLPVGVFLWPGSGHRHQRPRPCTAQPKWEGANHPIDPCRRLRSA